MSMQEYSPLNHFDYSVLDQECACDICTDWRGKLARWRASLAPRWHRRDCACVSCKEYMRTRSAYLAAVHRRDLYCESSWHASMVDHRNEIFDLTISVPGSGLGARFMEWLGGQLEAETDGWWEKLGPRIPLSAWFDGFTYALESSGIGVLGSGQVICLHGP